jgi:hypothetical protein
MFGLDQFGGYVLAAVGLSGTVLGGYLLYLQARLGGLRRALAQMPSGKGGRPRG